MLLDAPSDGVIYTDADSGIIVRARRAPSREFIALLSELRFGGGGLEYRRLDIAAQLSRLASPLFLELEINGRLAGSYMLASASLETGRGRIDGVYRGLLGLRNEARNRGLGRRLVSETLRWVDRRARQRAVPLVSWGCIEAANLRSMTLLRSLGAERSGELESLTVFRQWPKRRIGASMLSADALPELERELSVSYADCALRCAPGAVSDYWAVVDDAGIVAGARATLTRVDMSRTGSAWDTAWLGLLRFVPPARRRFDPHNFRYLRFSDVVVRAGSEAVWRDLLPTLLAEHDAYLGLFVVDPNSEIRGRLGRAGLFGRLTDSTRQRIAVLSHSWHVDELLAAEFRRRPLGIGPLDI